ncbi:flagellin N-terminal helical domain-containing protein [Desulfobacula toluolica]|uniref:Flagellin n=1 Tax=Desulfobacula toluolica (strain DSM 7467 / Tol2) TaxID=651182 RepID=K0NJM0_DESTT|nr:flagellin [Desulfobacula toluolica]CCK81701.1 FlaB: predicted flagellin B [Desulfobacula toluolica Tol2]
MALRINTNVASLNAHKNMIKTDNGLSSALEKLSSGLRINKAADDASGMAIADSLRSQALGLGQAIRNGNDGISIVQTADAALEESINIVNTIKQKSIQAAQDGQTSESRNAIQADITKLRDELDTIAKTTSFNGQKLLSGNFTDKKFQMGAYAGETVDISIQSAEANKIGHITTSELSLAGPGAVNLSITSNLTSETYSLQSIDLAYNNSAENGVGKVADAINKLSDELGISATASVQSTTDSNIAAGTTGAGFAINGVKIGALEVQENDADGALVAAINNKSSEHGITASVDEAGLLTLNSSDNRALEVTMDSATKAVMGGTDKMSTFGTVEVRQAGSGHIQISDVNASTGAAVSTSEGSIMVSGATATTKESVAAAGSVFTAGTKLGSGTTIQGSMTTSGSSVTTSGGVIGAGSTLSTGSILGSGTVIAGSMTVSGNTVTGAADSVLAAGSTLTDATVLAGVNIFAGDVSASVSGAANVVRVSGAFTVVSGAAELTGDITLTGDATLGVGSQIGTDSILKEGSQVFGALKLTANSQVDSDMTLDGASSTVATDSILKTGSRIDGALLNLGGGTVSQDMTLETTTTLGNDSTLADGSSIGGATHVLSKDAEVSSAMLLGSGSIINSGSTIAAGTLLSTDITGDDGTVYKADTVLANDIITAAGASTTLTGGAMTLADGSVLKAGSTLAINDAANASTAPSSLGEAEVYRLSDVDVTTQEGAQIGIAVADAALKSLDKVRSDLGSVQNQLTSTIANISTTKVNVSSAESTIRDVDFAEESANFTKMQILSQAGTFAMSQANASAQGVLSLLQ